MLRFKEDNKIMSFSILKSLQDHIKNFGNNLLWDGLDQSGRNALIEIIVRKYNQQTVIVLCENDKRVNTLTVELKKVIGRPIFPIFQRSHLPVEVLAKEEDDGERIAALYSLIQKSSCVLVINAMVLFEYFPLPTYFESGIFSCNIGEEISQEVFLEKLVDRGYESVSVCDQCGTFARRGGIVDFFSPNYSMPIRVEWFDDEVDSIRFFSAETQKSESNIESFTAIPAIDMFFSKEIRRNLISGIQDELASIKNDLPNDAMNQLGEKIKDVSKNPLENGLLGYYSYLVPEFNATLFDYLGSDAIFCIDETEMVENAIKTKHDAILSQLGDLFSYGYILPSKIESFLTIDVVKDLMQDQRCILLSEVARVHNFFPNGEKYYYPINSNPLKAYPVNKFIDEIKSYREEEYRLVFFSENTEILLLLKNLFNEYQIEFFETNTFDEINPYHKIVLLQQEFSFECIFSQDHCIFMNANIFNVQSSHEKKQKAPKKHSRLVIEDLQVGDYIVHEHHGIGLYLGIEHLNREGIEKDYILIQYKGADRLYVPIDQMHLVEKYVGQEGKRPKVNKLGSSEWNKSKNRIQESIEDMAEQLLEVHAKRQMLPGFAFAPDDDMQREFENTFPYTETDDQLRAINEVKRDMEQPHSMDRLVCGDVGFGKTEVAIRAAFKAVCSHKQVALLVPTTILAMQHYKTFKNRMEGFGVELAELTRFCTTKEQNKIFKDLRDHRLDIVIGTHKLLNDKLSFADLGLLIIDEEQRFGVKHKEKIKSLQENVDVLTLSATPIPRTLYFSLTGVKDMSIIETPPDNRLPIQTYVIEEMPMVIEQAVRRELLRGGQVYVVYNNVEHLSEIAKKYRELFPNSRILMGHGRMKEAELEDVMLKFQNHEADILVCTTIIETGIDMPNVNTMIVHNADHFGMAQLYQLKGRVGRSKRVAYAYLMYKPDKLLSEEQRKRLNTLREYTALGSGYKISMRDLEIRGSGNMLGAAQSGYVAEIGFELYLKMLQETIRKMKKTNGQEPVSEYVPIHTEIDINIQAYFPEEYISDTRLRIGLYQRLDNILDQMGLDDMLDELIDRFGTPDTPVLNLLRLVSLKQLAGRAGILSIKQRKNNIYIKIDSEIDFDVQRLVSYIAHTFGRLMLKNINEETFVVMDASKITNSEKLLDSLKLVVNDIKEIVRGENSKYNR
ncbi:MAG: transcription-repair coupling factor [Peptococcaceae bacterium]|nr:transcription-repair coupling factor [Peptococcaceae bacterium]